MDTKYKALEAMGDVAEADVYQMLAYAHRLQCSTVLLLYPETARAPNLQGVFRVLDSGHTHVYVATLNLRQRLNTAIPLINNLRQVFGALSSV
jgi:5-methylcytosine-specific restriction endonuclease McrBC regulatory subunit McrC